MCAFRFDYSRTRHGRPEMTKNRVSNPRAALPFPVRCATGLWVIFFVFHSGHYTLVPSPPKAQADFHWNG